MVEVVQRAEIQASYGKFKGLESLSKLKPIYDTRAITAGNAPGLNDGATALLIVAKEKAMVLGLDVLGSIVVMTSIAIHPNRMPEGPGIAISKEAFHVGSLIGRYQNHGD